MTVEGLTQRLGCLSAEVDEQEPLPVVDMNGLEAQYRAIDLIGADAWGGNQRPVQVVAPGVVGALEDRLRLAWVSSQSTAPRWLQTL